MEPCRILGRRVLVVEDDPSVRASIALLLRIDQHEVTEAENGRTALELVSRRPFDLVVMDFAMPGMLGGELALRIKHIVPGLPILMITAYLGLLDELDKPVDAILGKPFAIVELREAISRLLSPADCVCHA